MEIILLIINLPILEMCIKFQNERLTRVHMDLLLLRRQNYS